MTLLCLSVAAARLLRRKPLVRLCELRHRVRPKRPPRTRPHSLRVQPRPSPSRCRFRRSTAKTQTVFCSGFARSRSR
ncbi:hypothetical protein PF007_g11290 [Phytophthora fragariae]|uniref:Uncharacterized protein n=1 Tax=Phytophthora fragariae TaxID=53985 RepID=A0A6A4DMS1_9STRA|nr:hypothetical protein PF009_g26060 [Phytophthora fragariae]KAE9111923.1 hypothetical protein PF007_g11290 [Phytophthora fragariae]KAE9309706.1 hypothetical protein PF001_g10543 [Phytophthora fragariae]